MLTGVGLALLDVFPVPLTDARTAGVSEDNTTDTLESSDLSVTLNCCPNLLRTGGDGELGLDLDTVLGSLLDDGSGAGHILIRRVGARTDERNLEFLGPVVLLDGCGKLGKRGSQIGSEGTVDVGLELGQVDLDQLVVLGTLISLEVVLEAVSVLSNVTTLGRLEILGHTRVVGEE